jgi:hypothetical protein
MRRALRLAAASLVIASGALPCTAAQPAGPAPLMRAPQQAAGPQIFLSADGTTVYLVGELVEGSFFKFDAIMLGAPRVKRIYLASIGGLAGEGRLIAALVRKRRLDTHVEYYCASACTLIFVGGRERVIGREAQLGFHQAVVVDKNGIAKRVRQPTDRKLVPTQVVGVNGNDTLRLIYQQAGIDQAFIARVLDTRHSDMWTPPASELLAARVITRQAPAVEVPLPPGGASRAEVQGRLDRSPLWRQAAASLASDYRKAANDAWLLANSGVTLDKAVRSARTGLVKAVTVRLLSASDTQLDRLLAFHVLIAREQREADYAGCGDLAAGSAAQRRIEIEREEDALLAGIIASAPAMPAPDRQQAIETFASDVMPAFARAYRRGDAEDASGLCRYSYRTYEAIAELPAERRVKAYRAMLALPEFAGL